MARPTPILFVMGLSLAAAGEILRTWAAGHLRKGEGLTRSGPYAWSRNPLYLGSALVGWGFATATARWEVMAIFVVLLLAVYLPVIQTEAEHLAAKYPDAYRAYAREVPLLFPRCPPGNRPQDASSTRHFSWQRVWRNKEHMTWLGWLAVAAFLGWRMV